MMSIQEDLNKINQEISENFIELLPESTLFDFLINSSSKRVRSKLALLYLRGLNLIPDSTIYKILACGEMIHNASLLHDDVIDNASCRRDKTTISNQYSSKISILSGNYIITLAISKLLEVSNNNVSSSFNNCIKDMCIAEVRQFLLRNKIPSCNEYLDICKGKTACLFKTILSSCLKIYKYEITDAEEFAELFGINFQIKNDLDTVGYTQDIANGIYTAMDILGVEKTKLLLDNNEQRMLQLLKNIPNKFYKKELESLIHYI